MELREFLELLAFGLIILTMPIIIAAAAMSIRASSRRLRERIGEERWEQLDSVVKAGVRFAEQSGILDNLAGPDKKQLAVEFVERKLREQGIEHIDVAQIADLIENEVKNQFTNPTTVQDTIESRQRLINEAIQTAIMAAEQSGLTGKIADAGQAKKDYAVRFVQDYLAQHGIQLPDQVVNALIEAQLLRLITAAQQKVEQHLENTLPDEPPTVVPTVPVVDERQGAG